MGHRPQIIESNWSTALAGNGNIPALSDKVFITDLTLNRSHLDIHLPTKTDNPRPRLDLILPHLPRIPLPIPRYPTLNPASDHFHLEIASLPTSKIAVSRRPTRESSVQPTIMSAPHNILPPLGTNNVSLMNPSTPQDQSSNADPMRSQQTPQNASSRPPPALDTMRAYRACLNCRNRKSKCDLDLNQGKPVSIYFVKHMADGSEKCNFIFAGRQYYQECLARTWSRRVEVIKDIMFNSVENVIEISKSSRPRDLITLAYSRTSSY